MLSIFFPRASSSTSLSMQRAFCVNGFSMSSTRWPQISPLISEAFGLSFAAAKNSLMVDSFVMCRRICAVVSPVSHRSTFKRSASVFPFASTLFT
jgi:hypothetical protein